MRPALELAQYEKNACVPSVTANVLYMMECVDTPNVAFVSQQLERKPGETIEVDAACILLLRHQLILHSICPYDANAFIARGVEYMKEFYASLWDTEWDVYFTPERIAEQRMRRQQYQSLLNSHANYSSEIRYPTLDDIDQALRNEKLVMLVFRNRGNAPTVHQVVIYKLNDKGAYEVYYPDYPSKVMLFSVERAALLNEDGNGWWLPEEGIVIVGR